MLKSLFLFLLLCNLTVGVMAQTEEDTYNKYTDFNMAKLEGQTDKAFTLGNEVLASADKLPAKARIAFYNSMAKLYEDSKQIEKARPLYEKVLAAAPDYYVVHLALGHIYLTDANKLAAKMNVLKGDKAAYMQSRSAYIAAVNKVLLHLEKVQACDPYDDNLALIKKMYTNIDNPAGFATLNDRLKVMKANCVDVLADN
jgi:tetratricopeptide (TPR) repeat protein